MIRSTRITRVLTTCFCTSFFPILVWATTSTSPTEGLHKNTPKVHLLENARVIVKPGLEIEQGSIVIRDGIIEAVGDSVEIPSDAKVWDLKGDVIYPGLIESYSHINLPEKGPIDKREVAHWNPLVQPERAAAELIKTDKVAVEKLRAEGFTNALLVVEPGIFKGASALVSLADGEARGHILKEQVAQHAELFRTRGDGYPNSLMGTIALIRQTLFDARWHSRVHRIYDADPNGLERPELNQSLFALEGVIDKQIPLVFEVIDELGFLRATRIGAEHSLDIWIKGSGYEYRRLEAIKKSNAPIILPLDFPKKPQVDTPDEALEVSLEELRHWDMAPENPKWLHEAGVRFVLTTSGLKKPSEFRPQLGKAVRRGLPADAALAALTTIPAALFGVEDRIGTIEKGKIANLVVTDGDLFAKKTKILDTWVDGIRYEITEKPASDPRGKWDFTISEAVVSATLVIEGEVEKPKGKIISGTEEIDLTKLKLDESQIHLLFAGEEFGHPGMVRLSGTVDRDKMKGSGEFPSGLSANWSARRIAPHELESSTDENEEATGTTTSLTLLYPEGAYGVEAQPVQPEWVLVEGGTLWTCGPEGKIEGHSDLLIGKGVIKGIGQNLEAPSGALVIDASGKHVTPGIVDCHSHTAISRGINESGQGVTAEARIGDVLNSDDINIYRQLAGGVTVANILHGSANPIGGHNGVVKYRWGSLPEDLKFKEAPEGLKFALGENVKQSNWGAKNRSRYPQTRMGVEEIIRDTFETAKEYRKEWDEYESKTADGEPVYPPRRDLELEAIVEILEGTRLVHCHAYRQDEILMLIRLGQELGFRIATLQHILEGYKVADVMAENNIGGSSFSDWWAYKFEVFDSIPHNVSLMQRMGVLVSVNSDDNELARRLNTEATKGIKYGGMTEVEALNLVTYNSAKQLGIEKHVGSLEPGKHADFVIWNGPPLSMYTRCEQTWIEGRRYFDLGEDEQREKRVKTERAALIQKVLKEEKTKDKTRSEEESNGKESNPKSGDL